MKRFFVFICIYFFSAFAIFAGGHDNANAFGFALKVPMSEVENIEKLLKGHYEFMKKTHSVTGEK